jgi:hypothetical protein
MEDNIVIVSYYKSGRSWFVLRVLDNNTFDIYYTSSQPTYDNEVKREKYSFEDFDKVIKVGELRDWIAPILGITIN